MVINLFITE